MKTRLNPWFGRPSGSLLSLPPTPDTADPDPLGMPLPGGIVPGTSFEVTRTASTSFGFSRDSIAADVRA